MKIKSYIALLIAGILLAACKKDNYPAPSSILQGAIVYNGDSVRVSYNDVTFQLWQSGWGKLTPIDVSVAQNGSYSVLLFDGDYKLIIKQGQGPFQSLNNSVTNSDTILVHMQGKQKLDIEVLPYYMIRNPQFSENEKTIIANFKLEKVNTGSDSKNVQSVSLYISKTSFVDTRTSISTATINASEITDMNNITLSKKVPAMVPSQNYVFVRIGVKIQNIEDMIFSPVERIQIE